MRKLIFISFMTIAIVAGCGKDGGNGDSNNRAGLPSMTSADSGVIKGRWEIPVGSEPTLGRPGLSAVENEQTVSGIVAAAVTFTLSNSNFSTPTASGVASYGTLDVATLSDNNLRVCGADGKTKCTNALLRIYTNGTTGSGLWSPIEEAGLPITSSDNTIGLNANHALVLKTVAIGDKPSITLSNFTSSTKYSIPISVNFINAAAGDYSTTLVVEYVLQ